MNNNEFNKNVTQAVRVLKNKGDYDLVRHFGSLKNFKLFINNIDLSYPKPTDINFGNRRMMSSVKEYFETVPTEFIMPYAFGWPRSPQGDEFWRTICNSYRHSKGLRNW